MKQIKGIIWAINQPGSKKRTAQPQKQALPSL